MKLIDFADPVCFLRVIPCPLPDRQDPRDQSICRVLGVDSGRGEKTVRRANWHRAGCERHRESVSRSRRGFREIQCMVTRCRIFGFSTDPLTDVTRAGALELIRSEAQAEVAGFIAERAYGREAFQNLWGQVAVWVGSRLHFVRNPGSVTYTLHMFELRQTPVFEKLFLGLKDRQAREAIAKRLVLRVEVGPFWKCKVAWRRCERIPDSTWARIQALLCHAWQKDHHIALRL